MIFADLRLPLTSEDTYLSDELTGIGPFMRISSLNSPIWSDIHPWHAYSEPDDPSGECRRPHYQKAQDHTDNYEGSRLHEQPRQFPVYACRKSIPGPGEVRHDTESINRFLKKLFNRLSCSSACQPTKKRIMAAFTYLEFLDAFFHPIKPGMTVFHFDDCGNGVLA